MATSHKRAAARDLRSSIERNIIVRVLVEGAHARWIEEAPAIDDEIGTVEGRDPVNEQEPELLGLGAQDVEIALIVPTEHLQSAKAHHQLACRLADDRRVLHAQVI